MAGNSTVASVVLCAVIFLAVGISIALYFVIYKRHINKTLMFDSYDEGAGVKKIRRMPSLGSTVRGLFAFAAVVFVVFSMAMMIRLGNKMDELSQTMNNRINNIRGDMHHEISLLLSDYVDESIKKANSLVSSAEFTVSDYDAASRRAEVTVSVTPRSIFGEAEVAVTIDGETFVLSRAEGGRYEGTASLDIFSQCEQVTLMIRDGEAVRTEVLDTDIALQLIEYLPAISAKAEFEYSPNGDIRAERALVYVSASDPLRDSVHKLISARIVIVADEKRVGEKDITYILSGGENWEEISVDIPDEGAKKFIYIEAEDSAGYTYTLFVAGYDKQSDSFYAFSDGDLVIKDKNGSILRDGR